MAFPFPYLAYIFYTLAQYDQYPTHTIDESMTLLKKIIDL